MNNVEMRIDPHAFINKHEAVYHTSMAYGLWVRGVPITDHRLTVPPTPCFLFSFPFDVAWGEEGG